MDDIAVCGENLNAGNGGEIAVIGNDLNHTIASHGFENEQVIAVDLFSLQPVQSGGGCRGIDGDGQRFCKTCYLCPGSLNFGYCLPTFMCPVMPEILIEFVRSRENGWIRLRKNLVFGFFNKMGQFRQAQPGLKNSRTRTKCRIGVVGIIGNLVVGRWAGALTGPGIGQPLPDIGVH